MLFVNALSRFNNPHSHTMSSMSTCAENQACERSPDFRPSNERKRESKTRKEKSLKSTKFPRIPTIISILATTLLVIYYMKGGNSIPRIILLTAVAQILAKGIVAVFAIGLNLAVTSKKARTEGIPVDLATAMLIDMDTRIGGKFSFPYLVFHGFVALFIYITPQVITTYLGSTGFDTRTLRSNSAITELGSFDGAPNKTLYFSSGLILLGSLTVDQDYGEVAYMYNNDIIIPRKPVAFYEKFSQTGDRRKIDYENRVYVENNKAVSLSFVSSSIDENSDRTCKLFKSSDCLGYQLNLTCCDDGVFGFNGYGPQTSGSGFYQLKNGTASVEYRVVDGHRKMIGSSLRDASNIKLPRCKKLWTEMGECFTNIFAYGRAQSSLYNVTTRLAVSSIIRTTGFRNESGFDYPDGKFVKAEVTPVVVSNLSLWALLISLISSALMISNYLYEYFFGIALDNSLLGWIRASHPYLLSNIIDTGSETGSINAMFKTLFIKIIRDETNATKARIVPVDTSENKLLCKDKDSTSEIDEEGNIS